MKKTLIGFLIIVTIFAVFTGCAAKASQGETSAWNGDIRNGFSPELAEQESAIQENELNNAAPADFVKKLIKTADVVIEAKEVMEVYRSILDFAKENGGYEFAQITNVREDATTIEFTIKIPPEKLDSLINFAGTKGELISSRIDSEDITDSYYDSKIRLESLQGQLEKYKEFLTSAKTVDDIIRIQTEIDRLIGEIEILEGRLAKWDKLVAESTAKFIITQKADPSLKKREINWNTLNFEDMGYLIKSGLVSVLNGIVSVLQWIFIAILVTSPLWIVGLIVLRIAFRKKIALRKQQKKAAKEKTDI